MPKKGAFRKRPTPERQCSLFGWKDPTRTGGNQGKIQKRKKRSGSSDEQKHTPHKAVNRKRKDRLKSKSQSVKGYKRGETITWRGLERILVQKIH